MKIAKTVSEKVIAANRSNAQRSRGPNTPAAKLAVGRHAVKHGLLAKGIVFRNEEEEAEFKSLLDGLEEEFQPEGTLERMLVEEIGVCWWKLQVAQGWELQEIGNRRKASKALLRRFVEKSENAQLPLFSNNVFSDPPAVPLGWDCREVVLRASSKKSEEDKETSGHGQMEVRLTSSMETILRYETTLKRDLYRAIPMLQAVQDRRKAGSTSPVPKMPVRGAGHVSEGNFAKQSH